MYADPLSQFLMQMLRKLSKQTTKPYLVSNPSVSKNSGVLDITKVSA